MFFGYYVSDPTWIPIPVTVLPWIVLRYAERWPVPLLFAAAIGLAGAAVETAVYRPGPLRWYWLMVMIGLTALMVALACLLRRLAPVATCAKMDIARIRLERAQAAEGRAEAAKAAARELAFEPLRQRLEQDAERNAWWKEMWDNLPSNRDKRK